MICGVSLYIFALFTMIFGAVCCFWGYRAFRVVLGIIGFMLGVYLAASLHNDDGSIAVRGFYDGVAAPTPRERSLAHSVPFDADAFMAQTGVPAAAGEKQFTPVERTGFRPSIDINGIHSGYGGPGTKTIIPSSAVAKISASHSNV